jgi:hypothetical protein
MRVSLLFLATSGCLLAAEPPVFTDCDASACNGHQCDPSGLGCQETCSGDDDCVAGWLCVDGACELPCDVELDCGGYACDAETNRCLDSCEYSDDCDQPFYFCCREVFFQKGECRRRREGECLEDPELAR